MAGHAGAPLGPDDIPEPIPVGADNDSAAGATNTPPEFKTGTQVAGRQAIINQKGWIAIAIVASLFLIAILDGINVIHIDLLSIFAHDNGDATTPTTPTTSLTDNVGPNDGALNDIVHGDDPSSPKPSPSPSAHPLGKLRPNTTVLKPNQMPTLTPLTVGPTVPPTLPPQTAYAGSPVPNVDTSGPSAAYRTMIANGQRMATGGPPGVPSAPNGQMAADAAHKSDMVPTIPASNTNAIQDGSTGSSGLLGGGAGAGAATTLAGSFNQQSSAKFDRTAAAGYLPEGRQPAISRYEIWQGRYLRLELDTAVIVDLPGQVCAHLIEPAKDSLTGTIVLMPERTQLCGRYNALVGPGASRIQMSFLQATFPDGSTLALDGMASADRNGWSGNSADVNNHIGAVIGSTLLTSAMAAVLAVTNPAQTGVLGTQVQSPGQAAGQNILATGSKIANQNIDRAPTLSLKKSTQITLAVDRTIVLPPYTSVPATGDDH